MHILPPSTYPYTVSQLRADNPNTSFPAQITDELLAEWNVFPVTAAAPPAYNPFTETLTEAQPVKIDGVWTQAWTVTAVSAETAAANQAAADKALYEGIVGATQVRLDTFAQSRGYDSILSACTYASSSVVKFATEGQYCVDARDATWDALLTMLAEVQAGTRPRPTGYADIEAELPPLVWP